MVEVTAKRRLFSVTSFTPIPTLKVIPVSGMPGSLDGGPSQGWVSAVYLGKILINCWRPALRINEDGTTKMRKQRNEKNEKTDSTKRVERTQKSWKGPASNWWRRCSGGNFWEAREVPTEHAKENGLRMFIQPVQAENCPTWTINSEDEKRKVKFNYI